MCAGGEVQLHQSQCCKGKVTALFQLFGKITVKLALQQNFVDVFENVIKRLLFENVIERSCQKCKNDLDSKSFDGIPACFGSNMHARRLNQGSLLPVFLLLGGGGSEMLENLG